MFDFRKIFSRRMRGAIMSGLSFLSDETYLKLFYYVTTGKRLNLKNPQGFNEKLQWLKLHDRHPEYSQLTDKLAVKEHIAKVLGPGYTFPLLGKWNCFDEIDFNLLPNQFVLKCNHDSGSTMVIHDKASLTKKKIAEMRSFFTWRLTRGDYFLAGREYAYKGITPCLIAEELMINQESPDKSVEDYKFFCFNGVPKIMFVATDRSTDCK
ncbi:MAG: hypothetical protein J6X55_07780, partial [Victivallales bacterium]|nr:hypothetical protein [Victivallales bacterium]